MRDADDDDADCYAYGDVIDGDLVSGGEGNADVAYEDVDDDYACYGDGSDHYYVRFFRFTAYSRHINRR